MEQLNSFALPAFSNHCSSQTLDLSALINSELSRNDHIPILDHKRKRSNSPSCSANFTLGTACFDDESPQRPFVALGFQLSTQTTKAKRTGPLSKQVTLISDDGKFRCPFCQRPFQRRHDAQRHSIIHTRDKPYVCRGCDARFPRADRRANHWKKASRCWQKHHESADLKSGTDFTILEDEVADADIDLQSDLIHEMEDSGISQCLKSNPISSY